MSDIPIGSPQAPPGRHAAPTGWYPDPTDPGQERWWDGWQWSRNVRPREGAQPYPPAPTSGPPTSQAPPTYPGGYPHAYPGAADGQPGYPPVPYGPGVPARQAAATADGVPLAGWWVRVLAVVVDGLIVGAVAFGLSFGIWQRVLERMIVTIQEAASAGGPPPGLLAGSEVITASEALLVAAIQFAVGLAYHVLFLRFKAATPGKLATGLRVVPVDHGRATARLSWGTVLIRALVWLAPMLNGLTYAVRLVDALLPLWQPRRQSLHDLAAKTQVVKVR
ncbi:MAG: RDD family protein [Actinomycetes bacterium]